MLFQEIAKKKSPKSGGYQLYLLRGDGGTGIVKSLKEEKAFFPGVNNSC